MSKEKPERARFDPETRKWFKKNWSAQTTVMRCERCGLYYKPSLGHKESNCKVPMKGETEYESNCGMGV